MTIPAFDLLFPQRLSINHSTPRVDNFINLHPRLITFTTTWIVFKRVPRCNSSSWNKIINAKLIQVIHLIKFLFFWHCDLWSISTKTCCGFVVLSLSNLRIFLWYFDRLWEDCVVLLNWIKLPKCLYKKSVQF